jgi:hypothetical protein
MMTVLINYSCSANDFFDLLSFALEVAHGLIFLTLRLDGFDDLGTLDPHSISVLWIRFDDDASGIKIEVDNLASLWDLLVLPAFGCLDCPNDDLCD